MGKVGVSRGTTSEDPGWPGSPAGSPGWAGCLVGEAREVTRSGGRWVAPGEGPGRQLGVQLPYVCPSHAQRCSLALQVSNRWVPASGPAALRARGALPARLAPLHWCTHLPGQLRPAGQRAATVREPGSPQGTELLLLPGVGMWGADAAVGQCGAGGLPSPTRGP